MDYIITKSILPDDIKLNSGVLRILPNKKYKIVDKYLSIGVVLINDELGLALMLERRYYYTKEEFRKIIINNIL